MTVVDIAREHHQAVRDYLDHEATTPGLLTKEVLMATCEVLATSCGDVPVLIAEVERLQAALALQAESIENAAAGSRHGRAVIDAAHIAHQREWSARTFGPGDRTAGVIDHIRKELDEIAAKPDDIDEWADLIILAFDGAWRADHDPQAILDAVAAKQAKNEARTWPDWRTAEPGKAIEHVREGARS